MGKDLMLFREGHTFELQDDAGEMFFHIDYGTRTEQVNMVFQHFHKCFEIFILLNGDCSHILEGRVYPVDPLDIVLIKPFLLHKTAYQNGKDSRRLVFTCTFEMLKRHFSHELDQLMRLYDEEVPIIRADEASQKLLVALFNEMFLTTISDSPVKSMKLYSLFLDFMYQLMALQRVNQYTASRDSNPIATKIQQITAYLHAHYDQQTDLDSISKQFSISRYYLAHQFKQVTGFTFTNYIQLIRVRRAQEMLITTDLRVIDIFDRCGFGSLSQFNRVFLENCGTSPLNYRKRYQA